jgi:hypothetical protein
MITSHPNVSGPPAAGGADRTPGRQSMGRHDRRVFLARALVLGSAAGAALLLGRCGGPARMSPAELADLLAGNEAVKRLGRDYLAAHAQESTEAGLMEALASTGGGESLASPEALALQIRKDYEEGRTVSISGWVLSRTEARLCALAAVQS